MTMLTEMFFTAGGLIAAAVMGGALGYVALFPGEYPLTVRDRTCLGALSVMFFVGGAAAMLVDW